MVPETGHIFERDKIDIKDVKGKLVPWQVGEEVIIKDCKFKVREIRTFPADEIVLVGMPNKIMSAIDAREVDAIGDLRKKLEKERSGNE